MAGNLKEQKIPSEGDSNRQQSFQQPEPSSVHMQQTQEGQLPPAYAPSPSAAPMPLQPQFQQPQFQQPQFQQPQFQQPQQAQFQQGQFAQQPQIAYQPQFAQPQQQQQYFVQLPNGTMQAVPAQPGYGQPVMMPAKEQPTIIVNNAPSASAAAAGGGGGGGGGNGNGGADACLAGFCGGCAACWCCSVM